ncbi:unnamed protein product [Cercopithifilaria johnstoni]|uniref:Uncharacterized protein n=1 Tax=Cercopithifilaria johnstoni TaxID=2874296 RepID=A0A8J2MRL5_9BILA|nr:unnamed protein product [Cercopithifilaria johnstoni]
MDLHRIDVDSKTFVDRSLKDDPEIVLQEFKKEFGGIPLKDINMFNAETLHKWPGRNVPSFTIPQFLLIVKSSRSSRYEYKYPIEPQCHSQWSMQINLIHNIPST